MKPEVLEKFRALPKAKARNEIWQLGIVDVDLPPAKSDGEAIPVKTRLLVCMPSGKALATVESQSLTYADGREVPAPDCSMNAGDNPLLHIMTRHAFREATDGGKANQRLPHRVHVGPLPTQTREELEAVLSPLGVIVEVKPSLDALDELRDQMREAASLMFTSQAGALSDIPGMTVDRLRAFAQAACEFFKAKPWTKFEQAAELWEIAATPAIPEMRYLAVMGELGENFGVAFFDSTESFDRMAQAKLDPASMFDTIAGTAWSASLEPLDAAHPKDEAIWQVESLPSVQLGKTRLAGSFLGIRSDRTIVLPTIEMLSLAEAIFRTLSAAKAPEIKDDHISKTVSTFDGSRTVELRGLYPVEHDEPGVDLDALAALVPDPAILRRLMALSGSSGGRPPAKRPRLAAPPLKPAAMYRIRASLDLIRPPIWRDILIRDDATFLDLHYALQQSMGWSNSHLHVFEIKGRRISSNSIGDMDMEDGAVLRLCDVDLAARSKFHYCYDFGDQWDVNLRVERVLTAAEGEASLVSLAGAPKDWRGLSPRKRTPVAACLDGARAGPPDDCGGPMMYASLCQAMVDPNHPDRADLEEMYGPDLKNLGGPDGFQPEHFDLRKTNAALARYKPPKGL